MTTINLFIDTEFTDFKDPELISIALVKNEMEYLYLESSSFTKNKCSAFVNKNVLPLMNSTPIPLDEIKIQVNDWLNSHDADEIIILGDWPGDMKFLTPLLEKKTPVAGFVNIFDFFYDCSNKKIHHNHPANIRKEYDKMGARFSGLVKKWFYENKKKEHHALDDAIANFEAFNETMEKLYDPYTMG
jgi:3' exoribonuclease, RNase T-like